MRIGIIVRPGNDQRAGVMLKKVQAKFPGASVGSINLHVLIGGYWVRKANTKAKYITTDAGKENFAKQMPKIAERFDAFVTYDEALANYVLPENDANSLSDYDVLGGMLVDMFGKPCLFMFDPLHMYGRQYDDEHRAVHNFMFDFYVKKLWNRVHGIERPTRPMKFIVPKTIAELRACAEIAHRSTLIATDVETYAGFVSVTGFACNDPQNPNIIPTFAIPMSIALEGTNGLYWGTEYETRLALDIQEEILANPVPKVMHNGAYDTTYFFRMGMPPNNYIYDTMIMMHAAWPTLSRALYIGTSLFLPNYRYWKDDAKDVGDNDKVKWQIPSTPERLGNYWKYNGQDCANTLELCLAILEYWNGNESGVWPESPYSYAHVWRTYIREFMIEQGPCMYMSMTGARADPKRQEYMTYKLLDEADKATDRLRWICSDPELNPKAPAQIANIIYDKLGQAEDKRKGRTADKRVMQKIADKHPMFEDLIKAITDAKEPANNASKYGISLGGNKGFKYFKGDRFLYQMKAAATTTRRLASSRHNYNIGSNMQNVPAAMREVIRAEEGECLCSIDYSQSDSYFVAFESQDPTMMEIVTDDRDTHSVHVEFFFGFPYEKVVKGAEAKEAWVVDPVTGVRQIIKKVSHGTNYDMGGETMLLNIRRPAAISMVNAILHSPNASLFMQFMGLDNSKDPTYYVEHSAMWSDQQLAKACDFAQKLYYKRYPKLAGWKKTSVLDTAAHFGVIEMFGGSTTTMMGAPDKNPRFVPAAYGQGGTAGNINNAMIRLFYLNPDMWARGFRIIIQIHDELISGIPLDDMGLIDDQLAIMEAPCTIKGKTFTIPVDAELALSWTKKQTLKWAGQAAHTPAEYKALLLEKEAVVASHFKRKGIPNG